MGGKVQRISIINGRYKIDGVVKNSIGNVEAKKCICTTLGHALKGGNSGGRGWGIKGGKWDNCNSIINKIYLKINNKTLKRRKGRKDKRYLETVPHIVKWIFEKLEFLEI